MGLCWFFLMHPSPDKQGHSAKPSKYFFGIKLSRIPKQNEQYTKPCLLNVIFGVTRCTGISPIVGILINQPLKAVWCSLRLVSPRDRAQQRLTQGLDPFPTWTWIKIDCGLSVCTPKWKVCYQEWAVYSHFQGRVNLDHICWRLTMLDPHSFVDLPISRCLDHSFFAGQIPIFAGYTSFWFILVGFIFAFCVSFFPSQTSIICDAWAPGSGVSCFRWSCWALWTRAPGSGRTNPGSRG